MNDKSEKNIEKVKIGDKVFAYDLATNSLVEEVVSKVYVHPQKKIQYFIVNDCLNVTGNHPIWVNGKTWKRVDELKINDWLLNSQGQKILVKNIKIEEGESAVYNLGLVGPNNNYFSENILAHNRTPCGPCPGNSTCTNC
jgi:hypothetical protein